VNQNRRVILFWLILCNFLIIATLIIGGYTRLSNAGLSIVEWKPITGIIPPLDNMSWNNEFNKYKKSPEYKEINVGMSIEEFKNIFWIEYIHRIFGRLVGIMFIFPFIFFWVRKKLSQKEINLSILTSLLIFGQGIIGWYMVSSGITKSPFVSHFKLALHLILATIIYSIIFLLICNRIYIKKTIIENNKKYFFAKYGAIILLFALLLQIFIGGLVAGSKAGFVYNTFPKMDGRFVPSEIWHFTFSIENFSNILYLQFFHRMFAYFIGLFTLAYSGIMIYIYRSNILILISNLILLLSISLQILLGIFVLLRVVPLDLALAHQFFSMIVLSVIIWNLHLY
jgi:cytochrome c oxidase assembly protein subunit 15